MGFYVSPEQLMLDRANYAKKGIARGKSVTVVSYKDGILLCAQNPSSTLHKISEIYDRIAFAGVGKYSEFDQLRIAGVRHADLKGYSYSRDDVDARGLANIYAQHLSQVFIHDHKPMEVELVVVEVKADQTNDEIFHVLYEGSVNDEQNFAALGGEAEQVRDHLANNFKPNLDLKSAIALSTEALEAQIASSDFENSNSEQANPVETTNSSSPKIQVGDLEAAVLERNKEGRVFQRLTDEELANYLT